MFRQVLIISYETFRMHSLKFNQNGSCDLLICDEAHRLKNDQTLTNRVRYTIFFPLSLFFPGWYSGIEMTFIRCGAGISCFIMQTSHFAVRDSNASKNYLSFLYNTSLLIVLFLHFLFWIIYLFMCYSNIEWSWGVLCHG